MFKKISFKFFIDKRIVGQVWGKLKCWNSCWNNRAGGAFSRAAAPSFSSRRVVERKPIVRGDTSGRIGQKVDEFMPSVYVKGRQRGHLFNVGRAGKG